MRALIVDDSRFVRGYVRGLLEEKGIDCEEAMGRRRWILSWVENRSTLRWLIGTCL